MTLEVKPSKKAVSFEKGNAKKKEETTNNNVEEKSKNNGKKQTNKKVQRKTKTGTGKPRVKCNIPELKDRIFDCSGYKQAEDYKRSKEALESYVSFHCKYGTDVRISIENLDVFKIPVPSMEPINDTQPDEIKQMNKRINDKRVDEYVLREYTLESNLRQAYSIAWDMCTEELQAKLIGIKDFKVNIGDPLDVIKLFQEIWKFMFNFQEKRYTQHNVLMTWKKFYEMKQQPEESVQEYYERFKLQVKVVESVGGSFGKDDALLSDAGFVGNANSSMQDLEKAHKEAKEKYLAYKFIFDADHVRYGQLKDSLHSDYNKDYDKNGKNYPETMDAAYNLLLATKAKRVKPSRYEATFFQQDQDKKEIPEWKKKIQCHYCKEFGHFKNECKKWKKKQNETTNFNYSEASFNSFADDESEEDLEDGMRHWILLDNQSTTDIFCNPDLLSDIHECGTETRIISNWGGGASNHPKRHSGWIWRSVVPSKSHHQYIEFKQRD